MTTDTLDIRDDRARGRCEAYEGERLAGSIAYFLLEGAPAALVAVHTVVGPAFRGRGVGDALVRGFYRMAAEEGVPVVPICPYAARWAGQHPDEAPGASEELVDRAERERVARGV